MPARLGFRARTTLTIAAFSVLLLVAQSVAVVILTYQQEDNLVNQRLACRLLEKAGHQVRVVCNGLEVVQALAQESFDVVLMDVQMPQMDGFEATHAIREQERGSGRRQPVIAMTAYAMKGDSERCIEMGMDGYVAKPIQSAELHAAIAQALGCAAEGRPTCHAAAALSGAGG